MAGWVCVSVGSPSSSSHPHRMASSMTSLKEDPLYHHSLGPGGHLGPRQQGAGGDQEPCVKSPLYRMTFSESLGFPGEQGC